MSERFEGTPRRRHARRTVKDRWSEMLKTEGTDRFGGSPLT